MKRMHLPARRLLIFIGCIMLSGVVCAQGIDDHSTDPAYARYYQQQLTWTACPPSQFADGKTIQCALVTVPVDWADPSKGDITIGISRQRNPPANPRLLLFNAGGPDNSSAAFAELLEQLQPQVMTDHLVVGVDLRGVSNGQGTKVKCDYAKPTGAENFMDGNSRNPTVSSVQAQQEWWNRTIRACLASHATFLKNINTPNEARDLNLVRAVLGYQQADLYGVSSGTSLMAYADRMFPDRFDRVVLDSNTDWLHIDWQREAIARMRMDQLNLQQAFIPFMARHDDKFNMGATPSQVMYTLQQIYQAAADHRIGSVTPDQALGSLQATGLSFLWDFFVAPTLNSMSTALDGDPAHIAQAEHMAALTYTDLRTTRSFNPMADVMQCNDSGSTDRRSIAQKIADVRIYWAVGQTTLVDKCQHWPWPPAIDRHLEAHTRVHALMLQHEFDPDTPYAEAYKDRLLNGDDTRMVLVNNAATHGVMFDNNPCVARVEFAYLNRGEMPDRDVVCQAQPMHSFSMQDMTTYEYGHKWSGGWLPPPPEPDAHQLTYRLVP